MVEVVVMVVLVVIVVVVVVVVAIQLEDSSRSSIYRYGTKPDAFDAPIF